jgi:hypothetical protein
MPEKRNLFAVDYTIVDYEAATAEIIRAARARRSFGVSALAVHGLMECVWDKELAQAVNRIDMVVPDGQLRPAATSDAASSPRRTTIHLAVNFHVAGHASLSKASGDVA